MVHSIEKAQTLLSIYEMGFRIRHVELEIAREYELGEMRCPVHLSVGQELPSSIISFFQGPRDYAVSTHRAHAHYLAKRGNLNRMIAEIFGKVTGCSMGRGGSMHLSDPEVRFMGSSAIVGNSIPVGVGIAYGVKLRNERDLVFIFLGDGATEEGVFYESINFVAIHNLPVVFICENNFYSVYTDLQMRQPSNRKISEVVSTMGIEAHKVEFGDYRTLFKILAQVTGSIKRGKPCFIEIETYRWLEHCGPRNDDFLGYRSIEELDRFRSFDFLEIIRTKLSRLGYDDAVVELEVQIELEVSNAFEFAKKSPFPNKQEIIGDLLSAGFNE